MVSRLLLGYAAVELAVLVALASTIGLGRTLMVLLITFVVGVLVAGSQAKRQLQRLRSGSITGGAVTDGALVALAAVLVVVPGLVTSVLGLLLLFPPTRAAARPLLLAMAARSSGRPLITIATPGAARYAPGPAPARANYIDGEVLDVTDVTDAESPAFPHRPE